MAAILQTKFSNLFSWTHNVAFISFNFIFNRNIYIFLSNWASPHYNWSSTHTGIVMVSRLDSFTVPTVSQSQPSARILLEAADGISVLSVADVNVFYLPQFAYIEKNYNITLSFHTPAKSTLANTFNTSRQNGRQFADGLSKCSFLNEKVRISHILSLKFVPKGPIVQIIA